MSTPMNPSEIHQQLSALLDGELDRDQARFLLKRLQGDAELSGSWQRWHVTRDCLRGQAAAPLRQDFAARIALAIQQEAAPGRRLAPMALKWAGGFAVAASVAVAALLAVSPGSETVPGPSVATAPDAPAQVAPSPYREQDLRAPMLIDAQRVSAETGAYGPAVRLDPRIESYLVRHNEATAAQGRGFVPYATLVTPLRERAPVAEPAR
jgi:sigma-E factor negative regulatory protein RseA